MSKFKISAGEWVVVCDGRKALILVNQGDDKFPNLRRQEVHEHEETRTSEQGTDAPGRVHSSFGSARSSVEQTDWHDESERTFLQALARRLDAALSAGETVSLIVIAPPRALGMLRPAYSPAVRKAVSCELHKDYVRMPLHEIEAQLTHQFAASAVP
jgi:protein required for attachment to host cells